MTHLPRPGRPLPGYGLHIALGGVLTVLGLLWTVVSIGMAFDERHRSAWGGALAMGLTALLLPGLWLYLVGRARRSRSDRMLRAAQLTEAAGQVPVGEVAEQLGVPTNVARQALLDAVGTGRLVGRLDVVRDVFTVVADEDAGPAREMALVCRTCGASSKALVASGEMPRCGYCGATS